MVCRLTYFVLAISFFFFLQSQFASSDTCLMRFPPNLVRMTSGSVATKFINSLTSKDHVGVEGVKKVNHMKNMKTAPI